MIGNFTDNQMKNKQVFDQINCILSQLTIEPGNEQTDGWLFISHQFDGKLSSANGNSKGTYDSLTFTMAVTLEEASDEIKSAILYHAGNILLEREQFELATNLIAYSDNEFGKPICNCEACRNERAAKRGGQL